MFLFDKQFELVLYVWYAYILYKSEIYFLQLKLCENPNLKNK